MPVSLAMDQICCTQNSDVSHSLLRLISDPYLVDIAGPVISRSASNHLHCSAPRSDAAAAAILTLDYSRHPRRSAHYLRVSASQLGDVQGDGRGAPTEGGESERGGE